MLCHKHNTKMTLLFTSYVCDICNPPNQVSSVTSNKVLEQETLYTVYFLTTETYSEILSKKPLLTLFKNKSDAEKVRNEQLPHFSVREAVSNKPFEFKHYHYGEGTSKTYTLTDNYNEGYVKVIPY